MTYEAIRVPAEGEAFEWRVSVACIDASGPFSDFAGYDRKMVLLEGEGIDLEFAAGGRLQLRRIGDLAEFDGALAAYCSLLGGPCVDLNLMVAKSHAAAARVQRLTATQGRLTASASLGECALVFGVDDAFAMTAEGGETVILERWDLGLFSNCSVSVARVESRARSNTSAVFLATIGH